jgi:hypothetical protein
MSDRHPIQDEARRIEEDALFSAKGRFEAARGWRLLHLWIGLPAAVLAAVAGASAFKDHGTAAGILAMIVAAVTAIATFLNPSAHSSAHYVAGTKFNSQRNQARIFRSVDLMEGNPRETARRLKELASARDELSESSPQIPRWAFIRAKAAIEAGQARYSVDSRE